MGFGSGLTLGSIFTRVGADVRGLATGLSKAEAMSKASAAKMNAIFMKAAGGIGVALASMGVIAAKKFMEFETGLANVATLIPKASARMQQLSDDVKELAKVSGKDTTDLLGGLYQTVSAFGDDASQTTKRLEIAVKAAGAGMATTTDAVNLLSAVTKGYGDTSTEAMQKVSDLAFTTVKLGQTTFPELASAIGRVVPSAAKMNVSVEELSAGFATLTGVTGSTAEVSTQLAGIMRAFIKPTEDAKKAIRSLGFDGAEALVADKGLVGALKALIETTDGSVEEVGKLFRRAEALTAVFALTGGQADAFTEKLEAMNKATGATQEAYDEVAKTAQFKLNQALQELAVSFVNLGEKMAPLIDITAKLVSGFSKLIDLAGKGITLFTDPAGSQSILKRAEELHNQEQRRLKALQKSRDEMKALLPIMQQLTPAGENVVETMAKLPERLEQAKKIAGDLEKAFKNFTVGGALQFLITGGGQADPIKPIKEVKNSITELRKEYSKLIENINKDAAATGDRNRVLRIYNEELQDMLDQYKAWGIELPPILRDLDKQNKKQAEFTRKIDETVASLKRRLEIEKEIQDAIRGFEIKGEIDTGFTFIEDIDRGLPEAMQKIKDARDETKRWTGEFITMGEIVQNLFGGQGSILGQLITFVGTSFRQMMDDMKGQIVTLGQFWSKHWREVTSMGLSAIGQILGGAAGRGLGGAGAGFGLGASIGSVVPGVGTVAGGIIGGVGGFIGGLFGGGGGRSQEIAARNAEMQRRRLEENNRLMAEFVDKLNDLIMSGTGAIEITDDINELFVKLRGRGVDMSDALDMIDSAIQRTTDDIADMERQLEELPDEIARLGRSVDDLRRSIRDANVDALKTRQQMKQLGTDLVFTTSAFTAITGPGLGVQMPGETVTGQAAVNAILDEINKAKSEGSARGRRITFQEERAILEGAGNEQTKIMIKQLIQQENAVTEAKLRFQEMRETRLAAKETERSLEHNLPLMRDRLRSLDQAKDEFGRKGFAQMHRDLIAVRDAILNVERFQSGGVVRGSGLAFVHDREIIASPEQFAGLLSSPNLNSSISTQNFKDESPISLRLKRPQQIVVNIAGHEVDRVLGAQMDEITVNRNTRTLRPGRRY